MQILTTGKNLDIGEALRERIESRLTGNLAKYFDGTVRAHIVVELQKQRFHTECTLHLSTGLTMQAHGEDDNANGSFDMAAGHLEKQLRRYKRRLRDYHPERREPADLSGLR
jgi:ribosomal subunit interface protein